MKNHYLLFFATGFFLLFFNLTTYSQSCTIDFDMKILERKVLSETRYYSTKINFSVDSGSYGHADSVSWLLKRYYPLKSKPLSNNWDFNFTYYDLGNNFDTTYEICATAYYGNPSCSVTKCKTIFLKRILADFDYTISGKYISFTNKAYFYHDLKWDFGDGNSSTDPNPSHTYTWSGTYKVLLTATDTILGRDDTFSKNINITSSCEAKTKVEVVPNTIPMVNFYFVNFNSSTSAEWTFSDGTRDTGNSVNHIFPSSGTHTYTLLIKGPNCRDSFSDSIVIPDAKHCYSKFYSHFWKYDVMFTNQSGGYNLAYHWDFGDGNTSSKKEPRHTYQNTGVYYVKLTITDTLMNCTHTYGHYVNITGNPPIANFRGDVIKGGNSSEYIAYLIEYDTTAKFLSLVDSQHVNKYNAKYPYLLSGFAASEYLIKVGIDSTDPDFKNYLPTYLGDVLFWDSAKTVNSDSSINSYSTGNDINLIKGNNPGGPAFIGGKVTQGANKKGVGDPVSDILILLLTDLGDPVTYAYSNANGNFSFPDIAYGTYQVNAEIPGLKSYPKIVTVSASVKEINNLNVRVNSNNVITGIRESLKNDILQAGIYPNPSGDLANLLLTFNDHRAVNKIEIFTPTGQLVNSDNLNVKGNNFNIPLRSSGLPRGYYLLKVTFSDNRPVILPFIKK